MYTALSFRTWFGIYSLSLEPATKWSLRENKLRTTDGQITKSWNYVKVYDIKSLEIFLIFLPDKII